jgi:major membrane immunogen (membrane-anchored lipoprotein)
MMKKTVTVVLLAAWLLAACGCSSFRAWGAGGSSGGAVAGAGMSVPLGKSGSKK